MMRLLTRKPRRHEGREGHEGKSSLFVSFVPFVVILVSAGTTRWCAPQVEAKEPLRICADPNNLPFTNSRGEGFENRIARLLARDLGTTVEYTWFAQRRGFIRNTLTAQRCDVVMGLPIDVDTAWTTQPYYRSTYVFVTRRSRRLAIHSFDDPKLRDLRIGVELVGDDGANTPPAHALSRRGIITNIVGYSVYGDYRTKNPPSAIISAVARGEVDVAAAWGPLAGYFAARQPVALDVVPVEPQVDGRFLPQAFSIAMATRRRDAARHQRLEQFIDRRRPQIDAILAEYHVPRVDVPREAGR